MPDWYGSVADADLYHAARGHAEWTGEDAVKEAALLRASEYLDARYESVWSGFPVDKRLQVRRWPRESAFDIYGDAIALDDIPYEVEHATYELALIEIVSPGRLTPTVTLSDRRTSVSVSGAVSVTYAATSGIESYRPIITIVDGLMAALSTGSGGVSSLSGSVVRG